MSNVLYLVIPVERVEQGKEFVDEIYGAVAWEHQTEGYPKTYPTSCGDVCILERSPEKMVVELAEARTEIANVKANYDLLKELVTGCYPEKLKDALKENFDLKVKLAALEAAERGE